MRERLVGVMVGAVATLAPPALAEPPPSAVSAVHPAPEESSEQRSPDTAYESSAKDALLADVRRVVVASEEAGWFVDDEEYSEIVVTLLESACRTPEPARRAALRELSRAATEEPERLYYEAGELTDEVAAALNGQRAWVALRRTMQRTDECPFFVEPSYDFRGRQTERQKWVVHLEGGGIAEGVRVGDRYGFGGGGNGRLLLGWGFGDRVSLLGGGEVGGGAELNRPSDPEQFSLKYQAAAPIVVRFHAVNWLYDVETAPVALLHGDGLTLQWGARAGFTIGLSTLRARDFLPWAGVAVTLDHYFPGGGEPATQILRGGIRVGIRWLPD